MVAFTVVFLLSEFFEVSHEIGVFHFEIAETELVVLDLQQSFGADFLGEFAGFLIMGTLLGGPG